MEPVMNDHSLLYRQAKGWLMAAASRNVLEHCSEYDRARLLSSVTTPLQEDQEFIPELNEETHQLADKVVEQAIATIAILIAKKCSISILKKDD